MSGQYSKNDTSRTDIITSIINDIGISFSRMLMFFYCWGMKNEFITENALQYIYNIYTHTYIYYIHLYLKSPMIVFSKEKKGTEGR